jgi:ribosomal RNA-processing protein 12
LPILKSHIKNTELSHFSGYFVPLSERLYQKVIDGENIKAKTMEVKVLDTVVEQIWSLLPSYCDIPTDLERVCQRQLMILTIGFQSTVCRVIGQCSLSASQSSSYRLSRAYELDREK